MAEGTKLPGNRLHAPGVQVSESIAEYESRRPTIWTGHVILYGGDPKLSAIFYESVGMRTVAATSRFAVMEMRGGTHLVIRKSDAPTGGDAPFDLMVEDLDAAWDQWTTLGLEVGNIGRDEIDTHNVFPLTDPDGNRILVHDSHVVGPA